MELAGAHHPPAVMEALLQGVVSRSGEIATHFSALLLFLHGQADSAFDMEQRPWLLRFNTDDPGERWAMFLELCGRIGVDPERYRRTGSS